MNYGRFAARCEAVGMRVSTCEPEAMVLLQKTVDWSGLGVRCCPKLRSSRILGSCLRMRGNWSVALASESSASAVMCASYYTVVVKRELQSSQFITLLTFQPSPMVTNLGSDLQIEIADSTG